MKQIVTRGASENNLKRVDLEIPRERLVVFTGVSGSGKSSLAFDTLYAEGQRRYVESLSPYARQFLDQRSRPAVDSIDGLSPTISIEQKVLSKNPRSTVATVTEIYDYVRLLFARVGQPHCPRCGQVLAAHSAQQIVDRVLGWPDGTRFLVLAPVVRGRSGDLHDVLEQLKREGFSRVEVDGELRDLSADGDPRLAAAEQHTVDACIDRLIIKPGLRSRLSDSVELGLRLADGLVRIKSMAGEDLLFTARLVCTACGASMPELTPRLFSFNSPQGACPRCAGLGVLMEHSEEETCDEPLRLEARQLCPQCEGTRLRQEARQVLLAGLSIDQLSRYDVSRALHFFEGLEQHLGLRERTIAERVLHEIRSRLSFLRDVGVGYLSLDRAAATLSSGEGQRVRLATQIGSSLVGVLYILDEPSVGLHQRDHARLLQTLLALRDQGNSVIVVEHDEETIRAADWIVDLGPGAGTQGGRVVAAGPLAQVLAEPASLTGQYLSGARQIEIPPRRRSPRGELILEGASAHNLKSIDVHIPLGVLTCVTGVSGSGKSTLIVDTLLPAVRARLQGGEAPAGAHRRLRGAQQLDRVIAVDQSPIGRTPRASPATYAGIFAPLRELFAGLPESKARGYGAGRFSFNVKGGRCEACEGEGTLRVAMHFLPDVFVRCDVCGGRRYDRETLEVKYRGYSIADVLALTISEACELFAAVPPLRQKLEVLREVGLGYLTLGQPSNTLSGGEAQRLKLSRELAKRAGGATLYVLDEPTTGLHFADIHLLLDVLHRLVDAGHSVIVIEHQLDVIKSADYVIDLGPEGGEEGGRVVASGTPEQVACSKSSYTGAYLRKVLSLSDERASYQ